MLRKKGERAPSIAAHYDRWGPFTKEEKKRCPSRRLRVQPRYLTTATSMKKVAESRATPSDSPTLYPLMRLLTSVKIRKQTRY